MLFNKLNKNNNIINLLPFESYNETMNCFVLKNQKYFDILKFKTKNLATVSKDELDFDNMYINKFFKTYAGDVKIIGLNFPTNTKSQQIYIKKKIENERNSLYRQVLQQKLMELENIEKQMTDREYYLFFYSDSKEQYIDNYHQ